MTCHCLRTHIHTRYAHTYIHTYIQNMDILEDVDEQPTEIQQLRDQQLSQTIDFKKTHIDPAPFQLVERTSLYKVGPLDYYCGTSLYKWGSQIDVAAGYGGDRFHCINPTPFFVACLLVCWTEHSSLACYGVNISFFSDSQSFLHPGTVACVRDQHWKTSGRGHTE